MNLGAAAIWKYRSRSIFPASFLFGHFAMAAPDLEPVRDRLEKAVADGVAAGGVVIRKPIAFQLELEDWVTGCVMRSVAARL